MPTITLSVGIPTYNQAALLPLAIDSLLKQTRPPDEIVISDHYSTDETPEVIARYVEQYPQQIRALKPPHGVNLTGQYNFTLQSQSSDWISLLSSDDIARPNFCAILERGAARETDSVLVRAGWENVDAAGKSVGKNYMLSVSSVERSPVTLTTQRHGPKVSFAAFALKRAADMDSGPILETMESLADWALFLQMSPFGSFVYEHALISGYRVGHDGDRFKRRLAMWVRDEQRIFAEVIPLAAKRMGMTNITWIAEASRANFERYLGAAARDFKPDERGSVTETFMPWAASVGGEALLENFRLGGSVASPETLTQRLRSTIRPLAQEILGRLRR